MRGVQPGPPHPTRAYARATLSGKGRGIARDHHSYIPCLGLFRMIPLIVNGPALEPIALADAKKWLKLETSDEDDVIGALITAARLMVEAQIRRMLITQTWRLIYDCWPNARIVKIPLAPFQS